MIEDAWDMPIFQVMKERVLELDLKDNQKIKVEVSMDIFGEMVAQAAMRNIPMAVSPNGVAFMKPDKTWSPKIFLNRSFRKQQFRFTTVKE